MGQALKTPPAPPRSTRILHDVPGGERGLLAEVLRHRKLPLSVSSVSPREASNSDFLRRSVRMSPARHPRPPAGEIEAASIANTAVTAGWNALLAHLDEWALLEPDWDGEGGRPPSTAVLTAANALIHSLRIANAPLPRIYIAGDGEVGFRWERGSMYASASLVDEGDLLLYMHEADKVLHDLDVAWSPDLDLRRFAGDLVRLA